MVARYMSIILLALNISSCSYKNTYGEYFYTELPSDENLKKIRTDGYYYTIWVSHLSNVQDTLAYHYFVLTNTGKAHRMGGHDHIEFIESIPKRLYSKRSIENRFKFKYYNGVFRINRDTLISQFVLNNGGNPPFIATYLYKIISPNQITLIGSYGEDGYSPSTVQNVYKFQSLDTLPYIHQLIEKNIHPFFLRNAKKKK